VLYDFIVYVDCVCVCNNSVKVRLYIFSTCKKKSKRFKIVISTKDASINVLMSRSYCDNEFIVQQDWGNSHTDNLIESLTFFQAIF